MGALSPSKQILPGLTKYKSKSKSKQGIKLDVAVSVHAGVAFVVEGRVGA